MILMVRVVAMMDNLYNSID